MRSLEAEVLASARDWLRAERSTWLCTIVAATGSSPRPPGSMLACRDDGVQCGSLSGGCVEEDLLQRLVAGEYAGDPTRVVDYGVSAEENERLGLPCGGRLTVLVQALEKKDLDWLETVLAALAERRAVQRETDIATGSTRLQDSPRYLELAWDGECLRQSLGPKQRLLLVGAGQLSQSLAELALAMDYEVLVTDPRDTLREQWQGPAVPLLAGMPDDAVRAEVTDNRCLVITLTHDPRIDDMALMEALEGPAWYVGALGSRRTSEKRRQRLRQLGLGDTALARLHAPVGLDIGSKTPLEIAVAVLAELTQLSRRPPG